MTDYVVRDIALADFGRNELDITETEISGLMALVLNIAKAIPRKAHG